MKWAINEGFEIENILTDKSKQEWLQWKLDTAVTTSPGIASEALDGGDSDSHDTIGVICLDENGHLAAGI